MSISIPVKSKSAENPSKEQVVIGLLKSIALEETAIAQLLKAEVDKVQLIVAKVADERPEESAQHLYRLTEQAIRLLDIMVMKEWLLLKRLENVVHLQKQSKGE